MSKLYKQNCKQCKEYYEGFGINYCGLDCLYKSRIGKKISSHTKEHRRNLSLSLMGRISPRKGVKLSEEIKNKISITKIKNGDSVGEKNPMYGRRGPDAPAWMGGLTQILYGYNFTKSLKRKIKERYNYTCQLCKITDEEHIKKDGLSRGLSVHHIDYNKNNCREDNLITLCHGCNSKANFGRDTWISFFQNKICVLAS